VTKAVAKVNSRAIIAKKKRRAFLSILAQTGKVAEAARSVGFQDTSSLQHYRRNDEEFAEEWELALEAAANVLEEEAIRRATEGVLEPVFYKGDIVGYKTNYSDALMMFILRGLKPGTYRDAVRGGETNINFGIAVLPMTAPDEGSWEKRAVDMHSNQVTIDVEAKPVENNLSRITRGD
jgi:hypothetical protein